MTDQGGFIIRFTWVTQYQYTYICLILWYELVRSFLITANKPRLLNVYLIFVVVWQLEGVLLLDRG